MPATLPFLPIPMIDLRSDTVTRPTTAMRQAMAEAEVGDDVYGDDPTVNELERRTAELLGKEAAVYLPTGSMSNQVALRTHTEPGDLVLVPPGSHIQFNEGGAGAAFSGITLLVLESERGVFGPQGIRDALHRPHPFNPTTMTPAPRLVCVENTHNGEGGTVWPLEAIEAVGAAAREGGLALHMDGARLWHATAASGVAESAYAAPFDSVSVCFSKGLGAPVGSALAGSADFVRRARRYKQQFGGGFRQAGVLAAAALHALDHHRSGLSRDVENAALLAEGLAGMDGVHIETDRVQSNIVRFSVSATTSGEFATSCHAAGVYMLPNGDHGMRAVVHRDISRDDIIGALRVMSAVVDHARADMPS